MTAVARPRGPLPARVYWVRRALVLGLAFLLVFGFARLLGSGSDGDNDDGSPQVTAEQAAAETTGPVTTETPSATGKAKPKRTKTPLPEPDGPCRPEDITVRPSLDRGVAGSSIKIPMVITGADSACTFQVSNSSMVIAITSGKDLIWTSQECAEVPSAEIVVRSATPTEVVLEWNGRRSDDDCSRTAKWARAGWYHVEAASLGGEPTSDKFELVNPQARKVYKTAKAEPKSKKSAAKAKAAKKQDRAKAKKQRAKAEAKKQQKKSKTSKKSSSSAKPSGAVEPN